MYKQISTKSFVAIIISLLMAVSVAFVGFTGLFAYAQEGKTLGMGKDHAANIELTNGGTDVATVVSTVEEGQYMLYFEVSDPIYTGEDVAKYYDFYLSLTWGEEENQYSEYLTYNSDLGMYYAMLPSIKGGDTITFSANFDSEYVNAEKISGIAYLGELALGEFNGYDLGNVVLPATIELRLNAGEHLISVAPYIYGEVKDFEPKYTVTIGGKAIELTQDTSLSYTYTGIINVEGTVTATITAENAGDYPVEVRVYNFEKATELPTQTAQHFDYYESKVFYYVAEKTGYQYFTATVNGEAAEAAFALASKVSETAISSTNYPEFNYPVYLEEKETYYFEITYIGESETGVDAIFAVNDWESVELSMSGVTYLPVNVTGSEYRATISEIQGNYDISLAIFPEEFNFETDSITLHLVKGTAEETESLNLQNNFTWSVDMTGATAVYATWNKPAVIGLAISLTPITGNIVVGTAQTITLPAGRDGRYYIPTGLVANKAYEVVLSNVNSNRIEVSGPSGVIVEEGKLQGAFAVSEWDVGYFFLDIYNYGAEDVTFNVLVKEAQAVTLDFNANNTISVAGNSTGVYNISLKAGDYILHIENGNGLNVRAMDASVSYYSTSETDGFLSVYVYGEDPEAYTTVTLFIDNTGSESVTANVVVTNFAGALELGDNAITIDANAYVAYSMVLSEGNYEIFLMGIENGIDVIIGNTFVISDDIYGEFTVNVAEYAETAEVILLFHNTTSESVTFTATISAM